MEPRGTRGDGLSQDPDPTRYDLGGAETVRPDVHGLLPVFVVDDYPGYRVARVQDCSRAELEGWVEDNASALRARGSADFLLVNHVLLGGLVGAASGSPYVVKAHGSELEYSMRGNEQLSRWGAEVLAGARATVAGSEHIRDVVAEICGAVDRVRTSRRASTSSSGDRSRATMPSSRWSPSPGTTCRTAGTATSGCPTRATPSGSPPSWPEIGRPWSSTGS